MAENYSLKDKMINYSRGILAAGLIAASGCATSNPHVKTQTLDNKVDVPYKAVVTPNGVGVSVDYNGLGDLVRNTGKALGSLAYGMTMPVHLYHNLKDKDGKSTGKKVWAPGFRVIEYPEHSVIRSFLPSCYKSGERAQTLGLDLDWALLIYSACSKIGGNETDSELKTQPAQQTQRTYERVPVVVPQNTTPVTPPTPPIPTADPVDDWGTGNTVGY